MSKYPWHPVNRPPPADPSLAANIAVIGRVGKCLEAALDEIQREDDTLHTTAADEGDGIGVGHSFEDEKLAALNDTLSIEEQSAGKKRKRADSCDSCSLDQSKTHDADIPHHNDSTTPDNNNSIRMDKLISKFIMEAYGKAVAASNFDAAAGEIIPSVATNSKDNNLAITAPAAMLCGEIDHYNVPFVYISIVYYSCKHEIDEYLLGEEHSLLRMAS